MPQQSFEFISHESFPEDQYTKECVYLCLDGKYRIAYIRKVMQNGGMFWDVVSAGASKNGKKNYIKGFTCDSNFLREDILHYLESRSWEQPTIPLSANLGGVGQESGDIPF